MEQEIYTVEEVAEKLKVTKTTVSRRIREGKLKAFRTNGDTGSYRIREEDLRNFLYGDTPELVNA